MNGTGTYTKRRDLSWTAAIIVTLLVAGFLVWLVVRTPDDPGRLAVTQAPDATEAVVDTEAADDTEPDEPPTPVSEAPTTTTSRIPVVGDRPTTTVADTPTTTQAATETTVAGDAADGATPVATDATTTSAPTSTPTTSTTVAATTTSPPGPPYPTLADGSPLPVLGVFDGPVVRLSGNVRSEAARQQLVALAAANSKDPDPEIDDQITINPDVPATIGVRVIEMDSVRFPSGSSSVTAEHAAELDRVAGILNLFPDVEVLVIGHSDQRGTVEQNFQISSDRAEAVRDYLVQTGVSPIRINSRAVGEEDLLTEGTDRASLALNRRTEFVFYGLLAEF